MTALPPPSPQWEGSYGATVPAGFAPAAPSSSGGAKWVAIGGAFVATIGAGVATVIQGMAAIIGLAYDSYTPEPTAANEFFNNVFMILWGASILSGLLTFVALVLSIVAAAIGSAKLTIWVYAIFGVVCFLCIATWVTGFASIPS